MNKEIPVEPKNLSIKYVRLNIYQLVLNYGFSFVAYMLDENYKVIQSIDSEITGEEYNSWMNDDDMTLLILSKLGLSPVVPVPDNTPEIVTPVETTPIVPVSENV